jgi:GxxExxY protein
MQNSFKTTTDDHRFSQISELEKLNPITGKIIGCAYTVSNVLGTGFLEKVYENALAHELQKSGFKVQQQQPIKVWYDEIVFTPLFID